MRELQQGSGKMTRQNEVTQYAVPVLLDSNHQLIGFGTLHTNLGSLLLVFKDKSRLAKFLEYGAEMASRDGRGVGHIYMHGSSMDDIRRQILELDPTLEKEFQVVGECEPLFHQVFLDLIEHD